MIKERQSNFELLRIIAIFMIICFHYALKGGWSFETGTVNQFISKVFLIFGELSVNLFMLITGYFMIDTTRRWKQVLLIVIESVFYTLLTIWIKILLKSLLQQHYFSGVSFLRYFNY